MDAAEAIAVARALAAADRLSRDDVKNVILTANEAWEAGSGFLRGVDLVGDRVTVQVDIGPDRLIVSAADL